MLTVVKQCQEDFDEETNKKRKAEISQELLALLMYTAITPGRCKEYTTLQVVIHRDTLPPMIENPEAPNCIHITESGDAAHMVLADHKTYKNHGGDRIVLKQDSPLLVHLAQHLQNYRHFLSCAQGDNFLFVVSVYW